MSKELEYIQRHIDIVKQQVKGSKIKFTVTDTVTKHQYDYYERELQTLESIEQALLELQSIKETNPSEALKCLESIKDVLWDDDFHYQRHSKLLDTIEQALLKAQEPKQYLKWEDLKKSNLEERLKVKLNNVKYELHFEKWTRYDDATRISLYLNEFCVMSIRLKTNYEKQFFNDLHLERVEE